MKETIYRSLAHRVGKIKILLTCPPTEQATGHTLLRCSFSPSLQKASQHAGYPAEKSSMRRCTLLSLRLLLVLMSLCMSFLLTLAVQTMAIPSAQAAAPDPNGYQ